MPSHHSFYSRHRVARSEHFCSENLVVFCCITIYMYLPVICKLQKNTILSSIGCRDIVSLLDTMQCQQDNHLPGAHGIGESVRIVDLSGLEIVEPWV